MENVEIVTKRLRLIPLSLKHLEEYNEYASNQELTKYMCYLPMDDIEQSRKFLTAVEAEWQKEKPRAYEFAIMLDDINIGEISIYNEDGLAELGWILNPKYSHMGYAGEAARALMDYTVSELHMNHFIAHCDSRNEASYRLMEKLGLRRTDFHGGRKNKSSDEICQEYTYELQMEE